MARFPPGEARGAVRRIRRLVLAADPALVALAGELAEQHLVIQLARPRGAAAGDVGDLDVRDVASVSGQRSGKVLTHPAPVVESGQEGDAAGPRGAHRADARAR